MPFDSTTEMLRTVDVAWFIGTWGTDPWDATREATLDVSIGAPVTLGGPLSCSSSTAPSRLCGRSVVVEGLGLGSVSGLLARDATTAPAPYPDIVTLEVMGVGPHSARLCVLTPPTDLGPGVCQPGVPRCATSGTVVLSAPPSPVSGLAGLRVAAEGAWGVSSLTLTQ